MAIRYWLVVQPFDRALAMVEGGFVQAPWGALEGVEQMGVSDGVVIYCPREVNPDGEPMRSVVQAGYVLDEGPYRAGGRGSSPWRREVQWMREARPAPIRPLRELLDLTRNDKYWGERLRAGWLELSRRDFEIFEDAVRRPSPEPSALGMGLIRETGLAQSGERPGRGEPDSGEDPYSIRF